MRGVSAVPWSLFASTTRHAVRWLSLHTGVPALAVAAVLLLLAYHVLRKSARFTLELALVGALLLAATRAGWLRW